MSTDEITPLAEIRPQAHFGPDVIYAKGYNSVPRFCFDETVASVFPDMIRRSVPGYGTVLELLPALVSNQLAPGARIYDLGCSLGAGLLAMAHAITLSASLQDSPQPPVELIGVDNSQSMIEKAQIVFEKQTQSPNKGYTTQWIESDVTQLDLRPCQVVLLNYTLQFIAPEKRDHLIQNIFKALTPGGLLVISEKLVDDNAEREAFLSQTHHAFKRSQGYSNLEIAQKRQALEDVLIRETQENHFNRLHHAGFKHIQTIAQCLQFHTLVAQK